MTPLPCEARQEACDSMSEAMLHCPSLSYNFCHAKK